MHFIGNVSVVLTSLVPSALNGTMISWKSAVAQGWYNEVNCYDSETVHERLQCAIYAVSEKVSFIFEFFKKKRESRRCACTGRPAGAENVKQVVV